MSNPIADTAEFFAQRRAHFNQTLHALHNKHDPNNRPDSTDESFFRRSLFMPEGSTGQWHNMLSKLPFYPTETSSSRPSQDDFVSHDHGSDDEGSNDTIELARESVYGDPTNRGHSLMPRSHSLPQEDEALPSTFDIQRNLPTSTGIAQSHLASDAQESFFTHPFATKEEEEQEAQSSRLNGQSDISNGKAQWNKMKDKVKFIAQLNTRTPTSRPTAPVIQAIAPFYPPLFEPAFIALSSDENGRKLPPILMQCISVLVTDSEFLKSMNQWVFRIELQYGDVRWVIRRTITDFVKLHFSLLLKSSLWTHVPAPPAFPDQLRSLMRSAKTTCGLDRQDNENDPDEEKRQMVLERREYLTRYLTELLQKAHMMVSYDICEFLELSATSIVRDMGWKGKEGYIDNRINFVKNRLCRVWKTTAWKTEWVTLRDSYIAFCDNIASTTPTDVLMFDKSFKVLLGPATMLGNCSITLENKFRRFEIRGSQREVEEWMESINKVQSESPWVKQHRFGSFAPIRLNAKVKWFVDGENHFNAVAEALLSAKSEIYIADWWFSPELYLRRPPEKNEEFRIDRLLKRKASEGVMIYVVVYKEMSLALTINSAHTKQWLQGLHPNIIVQRHPDHKIVGEDVFFWSHHEKIIVVDNRLAFIGGLDLCFGRYDTHSHRLADHPAVGHEHKIFPGQDYSNPRSRDFVNVIQYDQTLVDRESTPRMPWHDATIGVVGPIARDISRHFIQRWNFLKTNKSSHRSTVPFLMPKGEYVAARDESNFTGTCRVQLLRSSSSWSSGIEREHSIYNAYMECISEAKHFIYFENQFFITVTYSDKLLKNMIGQALVDRIKRAHAKNEKFKVFVIMPLVPAFEGDLASAESASARTVMHFQYTSISRGGNSIMEKLREAGIEPSDYIGWYSLRNWDKLQPPFSTTPPAPKPSNSSKSKTGLGNDTKSPFDDQASLDCDSGIADDPFSDHNNVDSDDSDDYEQDDRDHYVSELLYIHDKLMIVDDVTVLIGSANINDRSLLGNRDSEIAMLIEDTEVVISHMNGKEYRASKFAHTLRMQLWKEHLGLLDFEDWSSLLPTTHTTHSPDTLSPDTASHVRFRSHSISRPADHEDDNIFECASQEPVRVLDRMSRTRSLYDTFNTRKQHAHHLDAAALDPLADHCYHDIWRRTADVNTKIYRDLFRCVPDDTVHTFEQHRQFVPGPSIPQGHVADPSRTGREIRQELNNVRGHLVMFPTDYLKDENMMGSSLMETVTPLVIFT
ncbi:hypothetical protein CLU79DRAFT_891017 [Phycomyces nitens]|nr:hypothetical protein CLU79DRAFT_891017 [Phycomyces nitens]